MKKVLATIIVFMLAVGAYAQGTGFQSPYKDGHPVAEKQKDYTEPVKMTMLPARAAKSATPVKQTNQAANTQSNPTTVKPFVPSAAKKQ